MTYKGWIALHRKIQDNFLWKTPRKFSYAEAWIDILMEAQHSQEPQQVILGMKVLTCNYGESLKSIVTWAKRWRWSKSKVHRYFKMLEKCNMIVTKNEKVTTRLTVCNYSKYDPKQNASETPSRTQMKRRRNGGGTQADTDNNGNNVNNEKNENNANKYTLNSNEFRLSKLLLDLILVRKADFKKPKLQKWSAHIDRMMRLDGRKPDRIEAVIQWCQQDDFWKNNILSTRKLREKFDKLEFEIDKKGKKNGRRSQKPKTEYTGSEQHTKALIL